MSTALNYKSFFRENDEEPSQEYWGEKAAGCIFIAKDTGRILLAHRSDNVDFEPHTWGTWGGKIDGDETPAQAVEREVEEETGLDTPFKINPLYVYRDGNFAYHNYMVIVPFEFIPKLNWENDGSKWVEYGHWPQPLHFGMEALIQHAGTTIKKVIDLLGKLQNRNVSGTGLPYLTLLAKDYGTEAGTGGTVDWKKDFIQVNAGQQVYDVQALLGDTKENCAPITVRRIFHDRPPASARIYDPFSMTGMSYSNVLQEMGFGAYSPAVQFLMTPIFEDLLRMQAIEFNDMVRKSAYSFQLINNKLTLFPIPTYSYKCWLEYTNDNETFSSGSLSPSGSKVASDFSNIPYKNHAYTDINDPGRQWIRNYFLANCKEILGAIRQKHQTIPIPGGEVTLDGAELRSEAQQEKERLLDNLTELLTAAGKFGQMEKQAAFNEQMQSVLKNVPMCIYIG